MNYKNQIQKIISSKEFLFRFGVIFLIILGGTSHNFKFYFLLSSGILLGIYYGLYNDVIWRPKGELQKSFPYRAHQLWIHIISGIIGSIALYFLLSTIDINNQTKTLENLGVTEFILFGITILSYVGLLPRILWYFSYAQQNMFSSK